MRSLVLGIWMIAAWRLCLVSHLFLRNLRSMNPGTRILPLESVMGYTDSNNFGMYNPVSGNSCSSFSRPEYTSSHGFDSGNVRSKNASLNNSANLGYSG